MMRHILSKIVTILFLSAAATPIAAQNRPLVVIDAGHGGAENGVVVGEWLEKDLVLEIGMVLGAEFVHAGFDVSFTRTGDVAVGWNDRRAASEAAGAVALIMLHAMGKEDPAIGGTEVYAYLENNESGRLAESVAEKLGMLGTSVTLIGRPNGFLRSPTVPTVMIELAHMSNPTEAKLLRSQEYRHQLGRSLVEAVSSILGRE